MKTTNRIEYLDVAKGIGILLVVWAHAKGIFSSYIYQFHMPFFFLISGFLYKPDTPLMKYICRKAKSLYIPFAFWNCLAIFVKSGHSLLSAATLKKIVEVLITLGKDGEWFGATWFLGALFVVSVVYKILDMSIESSPHKRWIITLYFLACMVVGFEITLPYMLSRTMVCSGFYALGYMIKESYAEIDLSRINHKLAWAMLALFLVIGHYNSANMGANTYTSPVLFVVGACCASYWVIYFSRLILKSKLWIVNKLSCGLIYAGKKSIDIVIWQFVAFRLVIALQMKLDGIPLTMSAIREYYPVYDTSHVWWIVYTVVGMIVPILWGNLLRTGVLGKILRKIHVV